MFQPWAPISPVARVGLRVEPESDALAPRCATRLAHAGRGFLHSGHALLLALLAFALAVPASSQTSQLTSRRLGDLNQDNAVTVFDLTRLQRHLSGSQPLSAQLQLLADLDQDGWVSEADLTRMEDLILEALPPTELPPPRILSTSPVPGEANVSLTRETIVRFTQPLAATAVATLDTFHAEFGGRRVLSRIELAADRRSMTLFHLEPLPASARIRVSVQGQGLTGLLGVAFDADGDGIPGGTGVIEFDTASISPVPGTAVIGRVLASELQPDPSNLTNSLDVPLAGVTITVDGAEQTMRAVTDSNGWFQLMPCPAGRFFVHVDGRTVTNVNAGIRYPDLAYYPFVGKAWEAVAGYTNNLAGGNGVIHLPLIPAGTLKIVSAVSNTMITFPPGVVASNPALAGVTITVPPGALFSDNGQRGGRVGMAAVAPDRLPEPLPAGLTMPLVITVQTDGPQNFAEPAPVCFPNLPNPLTGESLPPGAKTALWSFNHDTGRWEMQGPMTISSDGRFACSDPGVGIRQPGWHGAAEGTTGDGGEESGDRSDDEPPNSCGGPGGVGDPVHPFSGEFYLTEEDLRVKSVGMDFVWSRKFQSKRPVLPGASYNGLPRRLSMTGDRETWTAKASLGSHWTHSYSIGLRFNRQYVGTDCEIGLIRIGAAGQPEGGGTPVGNAPGMIRPCRPTPIYSLRSITVMDGTGRADEYLKVGGNTYRARGLHRELTIGNNEKDYTLTLEDRTRWIFSATNGFNISRIIDRHGNQMEFHYDEVIIRGQPRWWRLNRIVDTLGRSYSLGYDATGELITSLTDFSGRTLRYSYLGTLIETASSPPVVGTPTGNDFPTGKTRGYTYAPVAAKTLGIATITDGRFHDPADPFFQKAAYVTNYYANNGHTAFYLFKNGRPATNAAGFLEVPNGRVIRQTWGGQDLFLSYEQTLRWTTFNDRPAARSDDLMATVRDRNGRVKEYHYDLQNQIQRFVEYTGRALEPSPVTSLSNRPSGPSRLADPPQFVTDYVHNGEYQKSLITHPNGNATAYLYRGGGGRSAGNLLAMTNLPGLHQPAGDQPEQVRTYEYDTDFNSCCGFNFATKITDARGYSITNGYDALGRLTRRRMQLENVVEDFTYNARGQLTQRIHPDNGSGHRRVDRYDYYTSGPQNGYLRHAITDATGFALTNSFEYDARGNVIRWIDPRGKDTRYVVNELDQVVRQISREVRDGTNIRYQKEYHYDANNNVTRVEVLNLDENGTVQPNSHLTTTYEYEILNYMTRKTEEVEEGRFVVTEFAYDGNRNLTEIRKGEATAGRQPGNVVRFEYDERDLLYREIRAPGTPEQSTTQYDYDGNKNLIRIIEGLEGEPHLTHLTYDGYDRLVAVVDAMGNETLLNYDANGNLTRRRVNGEVTDQPGNAANVRLAETRYEYDPMNRLVRQDKDFFETSTQLPLGSGVASTRIDYSGTSQILRMVNANGHTNTLAYDTANRRRVLTDAAGNTITLSYDRNSNLATVMEVERPDLGGPNEVFTTRFLYDNLNRLTATIDNVGTSNRFGYDSRNNRTLHINGRGNVVRYTYDGLNRALDTIRYLTDTGDGTGTVLDTIITREAWDDSSRLVSQTDDNTNATVYTYDALDRKIATTHADGTVHRQWLDVHGNAVLTEDANGTIVTNRYDARDRLVRRDVAVGPGVSDDTTFENYRHDGLSRLVWAEDNDSTVELRYNSMSRVLQDIQNGTVVASTYDAMGNMTALFYPSGRVVTNTYDRLERLKTVLDADGLIARYDYVGPFRVKQRDYGNGTRMTYEYGGITGVPNPAGDFGVKQVTRTTHSRIADGVAFDDRVYRWDRAGNKTVHNELHAEGEARSYNYDSVDRLVRSVRTPASGAPEEIRYLLDGVGNRTQVIGGPDAGIYTMSDAGPEPRDRQVNQYTTTPFGTETHDRNGNLVVMNGGRIKERVLGYDFRNRLVGAVHSTGTGVRYAYDPLGRRAGRQETNRQLTRFVHSGWRMVEERGVEDNAQSNIAHGGYIDEILQRRRAGQTYFYHGDDQFSITSLSAETGIVVERARYSDFGLPYSDGGTDSGGSAGIVPSFTSREFDSETQLLFFRTRYHDPRIGRFIARDAMGAWRDYLALGNANSYVGNNPPTWVDPLGLWGLGVTGGGTISGGLAHFGGAATGSVFGGLFSGSGLDGGASGAAFIGTPRNSFSTHRSDGNLAFGGYAGAGVGGFFTNTRSAQEMNSLGSVWTFDIGFHIGMGFTLAHNDNGLFALSITGKLPGYGFHGTHFNLEPEPERPSYFNKEIDDLLKGYDPDDYGSCKKGN